MLDYKRFLLGGRVVHDYTKYNDYGSNFVDAHLISYSNIPF